jgi:hypothetical protein|tara:strand:- start:344 stop:1204 length:861 start_codon:yes stop_codon:yes gene_type:complete
MYMSNANEQLEEPTANPYNSKKSWHTQDAPSRGQADGLFFAEPQQATRKQAAPAVEEEDEPKGRTNYKKRYDDLKKHYDQKIADFKQKELQLTAAATEMQPAYAPPKTPEDLASFREQYPDLYETVETVAHLQSEQQMQAFKAKMSVMEEREAATQRKEAEASLKSRHPDFEDIRGDDKFHGWAKEQPEVIQDWIYNNPDNVALAIKAIDLYKMENGIQIGSKPKTKKSQTPKSSAADMVSTRTTEINAKEPKIWSQREIAKLSMVQFDKYESEIDLAIMEGRIAP